MSVDAAAVEVSQEASRRAALAVLAASSLDAATPPAPPTRPLPALTGRTVACGGDLQRVLVASAALTYGLPDGSKVYPAAVVGDVVEVAQAQADRLDRIGVTVTRDAYADAVAALAAPLAGGQDEADPVEPGEVAEQGEGLWSDAQLTDAGAVDVAAYLKAHPGQADRVLAAEQLRAESAQRATVLKAVEAARTPASA